MRILLADSGTTKVSWRVLDGVDVVSIETPGINASLSTQEQILSILSDRVLPVAGTPDEIHFFGAGVLPGAPSELLKKCFSAVWSGARVYLDSDMVVCARAVLGEKKGIACILGTGSNSCLWDGEKIEAGFYGGGYILGDEGSGNWIGRALLSDFAKGLMPEDIRNAFVEEYGYDYFSLVRALYSDPAPAKFLSGFALFATRYKDNEYIFQTVKRGFRLFFERNVLRYEGVSELETGFCGSVAYVFRDALAQACAESGLKMGRVVRGPIDELVKYYSQQ